MPRGAAPDIFNRWLNIPEVPDTKLPTIFLIGDSTVRNGRGDGVDRQWGWGDAFAVYIDPAKANLVNRHPWLADLLIWRARKSERLLRRMSGVLNETSNPGHLVSFKGMMRIFTE